MVVLRDRLRTNKSSNFSNDYIFMEQNFIKMVLVGDKGVGKT